ncbi:MAG: hypothetical protein KDL87_17725, partial [Verrucomicrobiae bacterium]|nr:hypothetical protein [Verrucomicrobiae bacterium]
VTVGNNVGADIENSVINDTLQNGTSVIIATQSGNVTFMNSNLDNDRHDAIQWTHSGADFGVFASGSIIVQNNIRTSGAGSINFIAGWTGTEGDLLPGGLFDPGYNVPANGRFEANVGALDPEQVWEHYVENGQFGNGIGSILIGDAGTNRYYVVGSRYGNTNLAGNSLVLTTVQLASDTGESDYAHIGFRDSGAVLSLQAGAATNASGTTTTTALDLNNRAAIQDNDPAVGYFNYDDYETYMAAFQLWQQNGGAQPVMPAYMRDINNDTVPDGVYAINSTGILDASNTNGTTGANNPTFISFSNHYMSNVQGNWWWQQIDAHNPDPFGFGGRLPESGAGSAPGLGLNGQDRADINIALTGGLLMKGGGRHQDYAQIGHGGNSSQWGVDRSLRSFAADGNFNSQTYRLISWNGASNDRGSSSIAR